MKNLLVISYYFPPAATVGSLRVRNLVKYLPRFGWNPIVLTVAPEYYRRIDRSFFDDRSRPPAIYRTDLIAGGLGRGFFKGNKTKPDDGLTNNSPHRPRRLYRLFSTMLYQTIMPDPQLVWLPAAIATAHKIMGDYRIDAIYSTGRPFSAHLAGYWLKKKYRRPWLADFRDPWSQNFLYQPVFPLFKRLNQRLEGTVLAAADRVLAVSKPILDDFQKLYPTLPPAKFVVLSNGFDPEDFVGGHRTHPQKFTITYTGTFSKTRTPDTFLVALQELLAKKMIPENEIEVIFTGVFDDRYRQLVQALGIENTVRIKGYLAHSDNIRQLRASDVLLLIVDSSKGTECVVTGKIFEYLATGIPILALAAPTTAAASLLKAAHAGVIVNPDDRTALIAQLYSLWLRHQRGVLKVDSRWSLIRQFDARSLAQRFGRELEQVLTIKEKSIKIAL